MGVGVGWCGSLPGSQVVLSPVVWGSFPLLWEWVLVGVVAFLGSQVVLSPVVSGSFPLLWEWVLVGVVAFLGSQVVLSPVVSGSFPLCVGVGAGWCGSLPGLSSRRVSRCLRLSPFMWGWVLVGVVAFLASEVVLSPVVFGCLPLCGDGCWFVW